MLPRCLAVFTQILNGAQSSATISNLRPTLSRKWGEQGDGVSSVDLENCQRTISLLRMYFKTLGKDR